MIKQVASSLFTRRKKPPNIVLSLLTTVAKVMGVIILAAGFSGAGAVLGAAKAYYDTIPELKIERFDEQDQSSFIYDVNGNLMTVYKGSENRIWATYEELPQRLIDAFLSVEDVRFFSHNGVDFKRLGGAFVNNLLNERVQGGSTITQQLIKNRLLSMEQSYKRKIQEAYMALELEQNYSKEQILEWYLNTILMGGSNYGVKAAAMDYFGKGLSQLSLRECATLAGMNRNPSRYNPRSNYYSRGTPEVTDERANYVLRCMYENGFITQQQYDTALASTIAVIEKTQTNQIYDMPYAVESILYDVETALLRQKNMLDTRENRSAMRREVQRKGYHIYSTIDPEVQHITEETVYEWNYPKVDAKAKPVVRDVGPTGVITETVQPQAAVTIIDYATGQVRGIVGGRFAPTQLLQMNRARQSHMPVGSSIKPLSIYGPALDKGASPASPSINLPVPIQGYGGVRGYPLNFSSSKSSGIVSMRTGIINSFNIVAASTLYGKVGLSDSKNYLISLGAEPDYVNVDGPGLALGTSGITPLQMAAAFGAVANKGMYLPPITFTKIVDSTGKIVLDMLKLQEEEKRQVFREGTAWMLTDMLTDAVNKGTGKSARINGITVAGKTGTSSDYRGVFFSGYTPYYSGAVWVGHDRNEPLYAGATGGKEAAPLFKAVMERIHEEKGLENKPIIEDAPESLGLVKATICSLSGKLPTDACRADTAHSSTTDWFHADSVPTEQCDVHSVQRMCTASGLLAGHFCPASTVAEKSVPILPAGHPAALLDAASLAAQLPGVLVNRITAAPEGDIMITPSTSAYPYGAANYCGIHTSFYQTPDVGGDTTSADGDGGGARGDAANNGDTADGTDE